MIIAELISLKSLPEWRKRGFIPPDGLCCDDCGLSYNDDEYKILHERKKLAYFFFPDPTNASLLYVLCHDCLFKHIKVLAQGEEADLLILDDENEYECKFYPEDMAEDSDGYNFLGGDDDDDIWPIYPTG